MQTIQTIGLTGVGDTSVSPTDTLVIDISNITGFSVRPSDRTCTIHTASGHSFNVDPKRGVELMHEWRRVYTTELS